MSESENLDIDIGAILKELYEITTELKQLKIECKSLNEQKKDREQKVIEYLKHADQPGIKYKNIIIFSEEKSKRKVKKRVEKQQDIKRVLKDAGVVDIDSVYNQIMEECRGKEEIVDSLKMKTISFR